MIGSIVLIVVDLKPFLRKQVRLYFRHNYPYTSN
jgi:hypothetical protein